MNSTDFSITPMVAALERTSPGDSLPVDPTPGRYRRERTAHWDEIARRFDRRSGLGGYYHRRVERTLAHVIPPGQRVLELGCGAGDLLAALKPAYGVGIDFSGQMIARAVSRHPGLHFVVADVHELAVEEKFDFIVLSDLVNDLWDVQAVLEKIRPLTTPRTRIVFNVFSQLWQFPLRLAQRLGLKQPTLPQNWLAVEDVVHLLHLAGFEIIHHWEEILWPVRTPIVDEFCNRVLVRFWPFRHGALSNFIVARATPVPASGEEPIVSVIVPARNEAGNIAAIFSRTAEMGAGTELVFVEGHSSDDTYETIERAIAANPHRRAKLLRQIGKGKGDAVRLGFAEASGGVLMILDADLTVPPEDLPRFYQAIRTGKGDFINGVRLVYPMEAQAMQSLNLVANKLFGMAFTWLLGQPIKDTLCGTKVLSKQEYERIVANRAYFGDFDPFGDFDLLFGAAKLNLKMVDLPVRYRQRTYGSTNIQRFRHGLLLLRMVMFAARRIKFV
jgi:SAM-dependent methyltransferase